MKRTIAILAVLGLSACGGPDESSGGSAPLNPAFSGLWTGTSTVSFTGLSPVSYSAVLNVAVAGQTATVALICPDGSGSVSATGSGDVAGWTGTLVCPAVAFGGCAAVTFVYQSATATLNANGSLTVVASGYGTGCSATRNGTNTFIGNK